MLTDDQLNAATPLKASRKKPLFGVNILLVDDSRAVAEAIRLMAVKSGARLRRADCLSSAKRHLNMFRPDVLIVDLSLPDGAGADLIPELGELVDPVPAVLIISGAGEDEVAATAKSTSADGFLVKPIANLASFQQAVVTAMDGGTASLWPTEDYAPDVNKTEALRHDYENMLDFLREAVAENNQDDMRFASQFLSGVAGQAPDVELAGKVLALEVCLKSGAPAQKAADQVLAMLDSRIQTAWDIAS